MPRGQTPFSLQKRDGKKYRHAYYVQFRDQQGNYTSAMSTGESSEGAARVWAMEYLRKGNAPTYRGNTFARFAAKRTDPGERDLVFAYREDGAPLSDKRIGTKIYEALKKIESRKRSARSETLLFTVGGRSSTRRT